MMLGRNSESLFNSNSERRTLMKKKLLLSMEKEVKRLNFEVNVFDVTNAKVRLNRASRYLLSFARDVYPYLVTPAISAIIIATKGFIPYGDYSKKYINVKTTTDSSGYTSYEKQYANFKEKDCIEYFEKWEKVSADEFSRQIYVFNAEDYSEEDIMKALDNPTLSYLEENFGDYDIERVEIKNDLSVDEQNSDEHVKTTIYSTDKNEYKQRGFDDPQYFLMSCVWFIANLFPELFVYVYRRDYSSFDFDSELYDIQKNFPYVDKREAQRKLEISKENLKRIRGE